MKILLAAIALAIGLVWFANENIQSYGLMFFNGEKWETTKFQGWGTLTGIWVVFLAVAFSVALIFAGLVAWLKFNFERREKELKEELVAEKQEAIAEIAKIHSSQIVNLSASQTNNSRHLENAYADAEKYKRLLANQEDENALLVAKIKGKDAIIMRLSKKIKRLL